MLLEIDVRIEVADRVPVSVDHPMPIHVHLLHLNIAAVQADNQRDVAVRSFSRNSDCANERGLCDLKALSSGINRPILCIAEILWDANPRSDAPDAFTVEVAPSSNAWSVPDCERLKLFLGV